MADDTSFIEKLRMNNIFDQNNLRQGTPFGLPDFNSGRQVIPGNGQVSSGRIPPPQVDTDRGVKNFWRPIEEAKAAKVQMQPQQKNVIYKPPRSDDFATDIIMGTSVADKNRNALELQAAKNDPRYADIAIKDRKQILAEKIASGKATDAEKHSYALDLIGARGDESIEQINRRGEITGEQIDQRGFNTMEQIGLRNKGNLEAIGARVAGQKEVNAAKPGDVESATQNKVRQETTVRQIMNTRPELSKFIRQGSDGNFTIVQPNSDYWGRPTGPTKAQVAELNKLIYGDNTGIIKASTSPAITSPQGSTTTTTPTSTTPTVSKTSKGYSYTVK